MLHGVGKPESVGQSELHGTTTNNTALQTAAITTARAELHPDRSEFSKTQELNAEPPKSKFSPVLRAAATFAGSIAGGGIGAIGGIAIASALGGPAAPFIAAALLGLGAFGGGWAALRVTKPPKGPEGGVVPKQAQQASLLTVAPPLTSQEVSPEAAPVHEEFRPDTSGDPGSEVAGKGASETALQQQQPVESGGELSNAKEADAETKPQSPASGGALESQAAPQATQTKPSLPEILEKGSFDEYNVPQLKALYRDVLNQKGKPIPPNIDKMSHDVLVSSILGSVRDFEKEYNELTKKLLAEGLSDKESEAINLKLGAIEREAEKVGIYLGETGEKKAEEKKKQDEVAEARKQQEDARAKELTKGKNSYDDELKFIKRKEGIKGSKPLNAVQAILKLDQKEFIKDHLLNERQHLNDLEVIRVGDRTDRQLRALNYMIKDLNLDENKPKNLSMAQERTIKENVKTLSLTVDDALSKIGIVSASAQARSNFPDLPAEKQAYEAFKKYLASDEKHKTIFTLKGADQISKYLLADQNNLPNMTLTEKDADSIVFKGFTAVELQAFKYVLSQIRAALSPDRSKDILVRVERNIAELGKNEPERAKSQAAFKVSVPSEETPIIAEVSDATLGASATKPQPKQQLKAWESKTFGEGTNARKLELVLIAQGVAPLIANEVGNALANQTNTITISNAKRILKDRGVKDKEDFMQQFMETLARPASALLPWTNKPLPQGVGKNVEDAFIEAGVDAEVANEAGNRAIDQNLNAAERRTAVFKVLKDRAEKTKDLPALKQIQLKNKLPELIPDKTPDA